MQNPYDDLRERFMEFSNNMIVELACEDLRINGYRGDKRYEEMTFNIINSYHSTGAMSVKMKKVLINYLIH